MRLFHLERIEDVSGVSGTGLVAEGIQFTNGKCVISWLTRYSSVAIYEDVQTLVNIHDHGGKTRLVWRRDEEKIKPEKTVTNTRAQF